MDVHTLKQKHPRAFNKAYMEEIHNIEYDWYAEPIKANFIENMKSLGLTIKAVYFDQEATIDATMLLTMLIEHLGLTTKYYPLYLAAINDNLTITFRPYFRYSYQPLPDINFFAYSYTPTGVFSELSEEVWNELIESQIAAEDWSKLALNWIRPYLTQLMRDLDDAYDYECSEENFIYLCEINGYQFDEKGARM